MLRKQLTTENELFRTAQPAQHRSWHTCNVIFSGAEKASRKWQTLRNAKYLHGELSGLVGVFR